MTIRCLSGIIRWITPLVNSDQGQAEKGPSPKEEEPRPGPQVLLLAGSYTAGEVAMVAGLAPLMLVPPLLLCCVLVVGSRKPQQTHLNLK